MRNTWWKSGTWNAQCDVCGFKFKSTELRQRWDGLMVDDACWEMRHPQELIRPIPDQNKLPWTRPESTDVFWNGITYVNTVDTSQLPAGSKVTLSASASTPTITPTAPDTTPVGPSIVTVIVPAGANFNCGIEIDSTYPAGTGFNILVLGTFCPMYVILNTVHYPVNLGVNTVGSYQVTVSVNGGTTCGNISASLSQVSVASSSIARTFSTVATVTLLDDAGRGVSGHTVSLASTTGVTIGAASGVSDFAGKVTFTVTGTAGGSYTLTATDTTACVNIVITNTAALTVTITYSFTSRLVTMPSTANWKSATYNQISQDWMIVAYGSNKAAYSSTNAETWVAKTLSSSANWGQVARLPFGGGFLVHEENATAVSKYSGGAWTAGTAVPATANAAMIFNGTATYTVSPTTNKAYTTSDGSTWATGSGTFSNPTTASVPSLAGINTPGTITVGALEVAGARGLKDSTNLGATWTTSTPPFAGTCMVGSNGTGNVGTSPRFIAVSQSGSESTYGISDDGTTWTSQTLPISTVWLCPVWCGNVWIIVEANGTNCYTSPTGTTGTWTAHVLPTAAAFSGFSFMADTNGQLYRTIVPLNNSDKAILITTDGS